MVYLIFSAIYKASYFLSINERITAILLYGYILRNTILMTEIYLLLYADLFSIYQSS